MLILELNITAVSHSLQGIAAMSEVALGIRSSGLVQRLFECVSSASRVRAVAARKDALSFDQQFSIGEQSGEQVGR